MCELCRHNPCSAGCPNAPDDEAIYICDECEEGIYDGDAYYEIGGKIYCQNCVDYAHQTAEYPPYEEYEPDGAYLWKCEEERRMCNGEL